MLEIMPNFVQLPFLRFFSWLDTAGGLSIDFMMEPRRSMTIDDSARLPGFPPGHETPPGPDKTRDSQDAVESGHSHRPLRDSPDHNDDPRVRLC